VRELAAYQSWHYLLTIEHAMGDAAEMQKILSFPGIEDLGPEADGKGRRLRWHAHGALVTAANSPVIGGGMVIAPGASITDGYLNLVLAGNVGKPGVAKLFPALMSGGKHSESRDVRIIKCKAVEIQSGGDGSKLPAAYADGEFLGTLPLRADIHPGALRVLVPPPVNAA
jgi:diacylglycerol kinase (ATP)